MFPLATIVRSRDLRIGRSVGSSVCSVDRSAVEVRYVVVEKLVLKSNQHVTTKQKLGKKDADELRHQLPDRKVPGGASAVLLRLKFWAMAPLWLCGAFPSERGGTGPGPLQFPSAPP